MAYLSIGMKMIVKLCYVWAMLAFAVANGQLDSSFTGTPSEIMDNILQNGLGPHAKLQEEIKSFGEYIMKTQTEIPELFSDYLNYAKKPCVLAGSEVSIAAEKGLTCISEAVAKGILKQAETQINCFKEMGIYVLRIGDLSMKMTTCKPEGACQFETLQTAITKEVENSDLVNQKLNHLWELKKLIQKDIQECVNEFNNSVQASQQKCDS